jgi:hypothetical protein
VPTIHRVFEQILIYDEEGRAVLKSTCKSCGEFQLVSVRDGSLAKWQLRHGCPDEPRVPPHTSSV